MRKLWSFGVAAAVTATLTMTTGSAASAGDTAAPEAAIVPAFTTVSTDFADDLTGCRSHREDISDTEQISNLP